MSVCMYVRDVRGRERGRERERERERETVLSFSSLYFSKTFLYVHTQSNTLLKPLYKKLENPTFK